MKHEKLRDTISDAMDALALEFAMTGRRDIDVADHVDALTTAILEQIEPEGEDMVRIFTCKKCGFQQGDLPINPPIPGHKSGHNVLPPQQPSDEPEIDIEDLLEDTPEQDKEIEDGAREIREKFYSAQRPSEGRIEEVWAEYCKLNWEHKYVEESGCINENDFKAAIKELTQKR